MVSSIIHADRCNSDQESILRGTLPILQMTSTMLQHHLHLMLDSGKQFGIKTFLRGHLQAQLSTTMMAADIAGQRRALLIAKQSGTSLSLSIFRNVINYVQQRRKLNIAKLQEKYNTLAFKVLNSVSEDINSDISKTVEELIKGGSHVREAKQVLAIKFAQYGIRPTSKSQLETIFRTQTQIAYASGKYYTEQDPDIEDILWGYRYVTTGDDRVRPTHAALDGVTLPKDDVFWESFYPPNGWNCRCQAIPLFSPAHIIYPPTEIMGVPVRPDKGFSWSAGRVFNPMGA